MRTQTLQVLISMTVACTGPNGDGDGTAGDGNSLLGGGTHEAADLVLFEAASKSDGLSRPRDVKVHPSTGDLWIVNYKDESMTVVEASGGSNHFPGSTHFLAKPTGLAFSPDRDTMATIHEQDEKTQGPNGTPADFMGPTMWSSNLDEFDGQHATHLDMLHNSPNGVGIAAEKKNIYWVFDGAHDAITKYDFKDDHGFGGADHSDGVIARYVEGDVAYEPGVASNLECVDDLLYIADTGNGRVAVLEVETGRDGGQLVPNYDGVDQFEVTGASISTLITSGGDVDLSLPSGLAVYNDTIYVGDNASSVIYAFDLDGNLLDWVQTDVAEGGLMGIDVDQSTGTLYFVDNDDNKVWGIDPS